MSIVSTPKRCSLLTLMAVHRPDAHLHQAAREPLLHDAGEGAGVRETVALELVVQVGMGVDVQDRQPWVPPPDGPQDG